MLTKGLERALARIQRKFVNTGYPASGVGTVLRVLYAYFVMFGEQRGWDDDEIQWRIEKGMAYLHARFPDPEFWESMNITRFDTGGAREGFLNILKEVLGDMVDARASGEGESRSESRRQIEQLFSILDELHKNLEREPTPTVLERFEGFVEQIEGDLAYVVLRAENGDELYGEYPADRLAALGIEETDRFLCRTVKDSEGTRVEIEALPDEPLSDDDVRAIYERIRHALGPGDDVDF